MSAIIMLGAATAAVTACTTATAANTAAGASLSLYGGGMVFTLATTFPIIVTSMGTIITTLTPAFPLQISPPSAKVRPENAYKVMADLAIITTAVSSATYQSLGGIPVPLVPPVPSLTFPKAVLNVNTKLASLISLITRKFIVPLTF